MFSVCTIICSESAYMVMVCYGSSENCGKQDMCFEYLSPFVALADS